MTQPRKEQLNILRAVWTVTTVTVTGNVTSTVLPGSFVSSSITQIPGGSVVSNPPTRGIVTTSGGGFVRLRLASNALTLDYTGLQIFGRLVFFGGNYVLSYKVISGGVETTATIPAGTYGVQLMYSEVMRFGEIPVTADVIYGYNQELLPSGGTIAGNLTVGGNTILGTNSSNTLSLNAQLNTSLIPTPDNTVSLGSSALRFATTNTTSLAVRADNTNSTKSVLTASGLLASNTAFTLDGNNVISVGPSTATAVNIGRNGITTTINGTLSATGLASVGGNLTVNGSSSVFNGDLNVTGTLTTGSLLFTDLNVSGNTVLGTNSSNTIEFLATFISALFPQTPDTYDIGSIADYWRNLHSTRLFTHYDTTNSIYSFLEPNNLFSSTDFDVDGYGALMLGISYATQVNVGNFGSNTTIDGYDVVVTTHDIFRVKDQTTNLFTIDKNIPEIRMNVPQLIFDSGIGHPILTQDQQIAGSHAVDFIVQAQHGSDTFPDPPSIFNKGGTLLLKGGDSGFGNLDGYHVDGYPGAVIMRTGSFAIASDDGLFTDLSLGLFLINDPGEEGISGLFLNLFEGNQIVDTNTTTGSIFGLDLHKGALSFGMNDLEFDGMAGAFGTVRIYQDSLNSSDTPKDGMNMTIHAQNGQGSTMSGSRGGDLILLYGAGGGPGGERGNIVLGDLEGIGSQAGGGIGVICIATAQSAPVGSISTAAQLYVDPVDGHVKIMKPNGSVLDLG